APVNLRKPRCRLLISGVLDSFARRLAPAIDRGAAHATVAIVEHGGARRRRIGHYFKTSKRLLKSSVHSTGFLGFSCGLRSSGGSTAYCFSSFSKSKLRVRMIQSEL